MELPGEAASECGNWRQLALTFNRRLLLWFCLVSANGDMQKENLKTKNRKTEQLKTENRKRYTTATTNHSAAVAAHYWPISRTAGKGP